MSLLEPYRRKCPNCGKVFEVYCRSDEWGYAYNGRLTCSYHCMRDMERKHSREELTGFGASHLAQLYRMYSEGKTYDQIIQTATAKCAGIDTKEKAATRIRGWASKHPDHAKAILQHLYDKGAVLNAKEGGT